MEIAKRDGSKEARQAWLNFRIGRAALPEDAELRAEVLRLQREADERIATEDARFGDKLRQGFRNGQL